MATTRGIMQTPIRHAGATMDASPGWDSFLRDCVLAIPFWEGGGKPRDARRSSSVGTLSGDATWVRTPYGWGVESNPNNDSAGSDEINFSNSDGKQDRASDGTYSWLWFGIPKSYTAEQWTGLVSRVDTSASTDSVYTYQRNGGGNELRVWHNNAGAVIVGNLDTIFASATPTTFGATYEPVSNRVATFLNGAIHYDTTISNAPLACTGGELQIGASRARTECMNITTIAFLEFTRTLSDGEVQQWARDPMGPFYPESPLASAPPAGGSGPLYFHNKARHWRKM